jgi:FkbM family methyltransferase
MNIATFLRWIIKLPARVFRRLIWKIYVQHQTIYTFPTRQGIFTVYGKDAGIGYSLFYKREYEGELVAQTFTFLRTQGKIPAMGQGTLVDIGANIGVIGIGAAYMGQVQKIIAFEPDPNNFALLQRNVSQNGLTDCAICLPYAVAEQNGELQFELSRDNFGDHRLHSASGIAQDVELFDESHRQIITVQSHPLDEMINGLPTQFTNEIALVWIDVQGYEGYIFRSGQGFLGRGMPVMVEIWPYGVRRAGMSDTQFCEIVNKLWKGYWRLVNGEFKLFTIESFAGFYAGLGRGQFENVIFD